MNHTTLLDRKTFSENIFHGLKPELQAHKGSKPYEDLIDAFYAYLKAPSDEKRQVFYHANEVLEDYVYFELKRQNGPSMKETGWGSL